MILEDSNDDDDINEELHTSVMSASVRIRKNYVSGEENDDDSSVGQMPSVRLNSEQVQTMAAMGE